MLARIKSLIGRTGAKTSTPNFSVPRGETVTTPQEPSPLPHAELPSVEFPLAGLTPKLRSAAEVIVRKTQVPAALAAQSVLSVASLAVASRAQVQTLGSAANATAAFVTIARSGERKSAADKIARTGIDRVIMRLREEHKIAMANHKAALSGLGRGDERPEAPVCPGFLVTEATIECAFKAIATGCGFLGWFTDEAAAFWGGYSMSKDQRAKSSGVVSNLWDGAYFFRPRGSQDGDGYVPPTATTINLMFQTTLIRDTYGDEFLIGQGLLARMLPSWPESNMGNGNIDARARRMKRLQRISTMQSRPVWLQLWKIRPSVCSHFPRRHSAFVSSFTTTSNASLARAGGPRTSRGSPPRRLNMHAGSRRS